MQALQLLPMLMAGAGAVSEIQLQSKEKAALDRAMYFSKHPEAVTNLVKGATQPLEAGLKAGVGNDVNATLAEQGLSQAPGIQSEVLAQALAPYYQNAQAMALQQVLGTIGMPLQTLTAMQGMQSPASLAMAMQGLLNARLPQYGSGGGGGGVYDDPSITGPTQGDVGIAPDWASSVPTNMGGVAGSVPFPMGGG